MPTFYLTEAYALAIESCWEIIWEFSCDYEAFNGSNHFEMDYLTFDILPNTLKDFVELEWTGNAAVTAAAKQSVSKRAHSSSSHANWLFPTQLDQDGDNLINQAYGGVDPDDTQVDSDGDNLSDYYEISYGTNPQDADTDDDGLTDAEEALLYYTDPTQADTDGDRLTDYLELVQGWLVAYTDKNGATQITRVWSNPFYTDADGDNLDDFKEFVFGFHPEIPTDANAIQNIVQFDNIAVAETDAPVMLLKMEEAAGSSVFGDSSGERNNATCDWTSATCPTTTDGVYGEGLLFDGSNDVIEVTDTSAIQLDNRNFTLAAWARRDSTGSDDFIFSQGTTTNNYGLHFGFRNSNLFYLCLLGQLTSTAPSPIQTTIGINWACTYDAQTNTRILYRDGVAVATDTTSSDYLGNGQLYVGARLASSTPFNGALDEAIIYNNRVLTVSEIGDVMNGPL